MIHLTNCHGEWNILLAILSSAPIIGVWIKHRLSTHNHDGELESVKK